MKPMELSEPPPDDVKNWKSDAPVIATPAARKALAREKPWILMGGSPAALKPPWANAPGVPPPSSARSATAERGWCAAGAAGKRLLSAGAAGTGRSAENGAAGARSSAKARSATMVRAAGSELLTAAVVARSRERLTPRGT